MNCVGCGTTLLTPVADGLCGFCRPDPPKRLERHVARLRRQAAPLPLSTGEATQRAVKLRAEGMFYSDIAIVMRLYHGWSADADSWRVRCRRAGSPPRFHGSQVGLRSQVTA